MEEANQEPKYTYEFISLMDIDKYPEIETLLTQSNAELIDYDAALENEKEQYVQTVNQYLSEAGIAEVSAEEIESVQTCGIGTTIFGKRSRRGLSIAHSV